MKHSLYLILFCCCSTSYGQTVQETLSSLGLNFPRGLYNDLNDLPYDYHLDLIGHKVNFDTLIITQAENKVFHGPNNEKPILDTFATHVYYANRKTNFLTDNILITKRDSIHRKYIGKQIISISHHSSDTLYSIRLYKYKSNGELDSVVEKGTHFYAAKRSDSTHLKQYVNPSKVKAYKKNGRLVKVVNETRGEYHIFTYKQDVLYQIITFDSGTKQKQNITTFNQQGLEVSMVNAIQQTENQYSFDSKGRWIKRIQFINGILYEVTTRKYID